jgi:hypothetical protein
MLIHICIFCNSLTGTKGLSKTQADRIHALRSLSRVYHKLRYPKTSRHTRIGDQSERERDDREREAEESRQREEEEKRKVFEEERKKREEEKARREEERARADAVSVLVR